MDETMIEAVGSLPFAESTLAFHLTMRCRKEAAHQLDAILVQLPHIWILRTISSFDCLMVPPD